MNYVHYAEVVVMPVQFTCLREHISSFYLV